MKITKKQLNENTNQILEPNPYMTFKPVMTINHKPHPIMIGPKHVAYASKNYGGMLDERTLKVIPCSYRGCDLSLEEHTYDTVIPVIITEEGKGDEHTEAIQDLLRKAIDKVEDGVFDGFIFVEGEK